MIIRTFLVSFFALNSCAITSLWGTLLSPSRFHSNGQSNQHIIDAKVTKVDDEYMKGVIHEAAGFTLGVGNALFGKSDDIGRALNYLTKLPSSNLYYDSRDGTLYMDTAVLDDKKYQFKIETIDPSAKLHEIANSALISTHHFPTQSLFHSLMFLRGANDNTIVHIFKPMESCNLKGVVLRDEYINTEVNFNKTRVTYVHAPTELLQQVAWLCHDVIDALVALENENVVHMQVNLNHIYIDYATPKYILADFEKVQRRGSPIYSDDQVREIGISSSSFDLVSFGIALVYLLEGNEAYNPGNLSPKDILEHMRTGDVVVERSGEHNFLLVNFITRLLNSQQEQLTARDFINHPFIKKHYQMA